MTKIDLRAPRRAGHVLKGLNLVSSMDVPLWTGETEAVASHIAGLAAKRRDGGATCLAAHINAANYYRLLQEPALKSALASDALLLFDGIAMKLGAVVLGEGWISDLCGTDIFPLLMVRAKHLGLRPYFLGATKKVVESAAQRVKATYPDLTLAGYHHGYFTELEEESIIERINRSRADLLLVGMGFGRQEAFALRHRRALQVGVIWTVGGLFDFVSGLTPRAPRWMVNCRLEWLYRLAREPRRMWHRNLVCAPTVLTHALLRSLRRGGGPS